MNPISIYIVDDHKPMRNLFKAMLKEDKKGETDNGDTAVKQIIMLNPDILLIDQNLVGKSGLDVIKTIQTALCDTNSILMSMGNLFSYKNDCKKLTVNGLMSKTNSKWEIINIIKRVASGEKYYDV